MHDLSILQAYLLCAVNKNGHIAGVAGTTSEKQACLVAAGLLELELARCVHISDSHEIHITGPLPEDKPYLKAMYDFLQWRKTTQISDLLPVFMTSPADFLEGLISHPQKKLLPDLMNAVGASLIDLGLIDKATARLLGKERGYIPRREAIYPVVETLRAELLEDGPMTEEAVALTVLLDYAGCLNPYFSDFERKEIQPRLLQLRAQPHGKLVKEVVAQFETSIALFGGAMTAFDPA